MTPIAESKPDLLMKTIASPVGELRLFARGDALTGVYAGMQTPPEARAGKAQILDRAAAQLAAYFAGELTTFDVPLAPEGTEFQQKVWMLLRAIPYGETRTYVSRVMGNLARYRALDAGPSSVAALSLPVDPSLRAEPGSV